MRDFIILLGQLLFVAFLQTVLESFFNPDEQANHIKVLNIACVTVCYVLLLHYMYQHLWLTLINTWQIRF